MLTSLERGGCQFLSTDECISIISSAIISSMMAYVGLSVTTYLALIFVGKGYNPWRLALLVAECSRMVSINLGPLKDRSNDLIAFLEEKVGVKPELEGDMITFKEGEKEPPHAGLIKTYLKRFLHREGLRKRYRVLREKGVLNIIKVEEE